VHSSRPLDSYCCGSSMFIDDGAVETEVLLLLRDELADDAGASLLGSSSTCGCARFSCTQSLSYEFNYDQGQPCHT
jgi:hypothetical protein